MAKAKGLRVAKRGPVGSGVGAKELLFKVII